MPTWEKSLPIVSIEIPCSSDHVGPAISRGSPAGISFACWHRTMASSRSPKARSPAMSSSGLVALVQFGAEHHLVVVGVGDGPADVRPPHVEHLPRQIGLFVGGGGQRLVQLDETLRGDGAQQLSLVREVAVGRSGAHARASGDLPEREALRPLLRDQPQRRLGQRPFEIAVVIGAALLGRRLGNLFSTRHVYDVNITIC